MSVDTQSRLLNGLWGPHDRIAAGWRRAGVIWVQKRNPGKPDDSRPSTAREYVLGQLRTQIVSGELRGGTRLVQSSIANDLGVSTTPVREALFDLASEGLVQLDSQRGAIVNQPDMDELWEVFELRRVLEPMVVRLAIPRITLSLASRLDELCSSMEETTDPIQWVPLNRIFHSVFMDASGRPRLSGIVGALHDVAASFLTTSIRFRPEMMEEANDDHRQLAEAARNGDIIRAMEVSRDHMNILMRAVRTLYQGDPPEDIIGVDPDEL